jgi:hypothetical protein
MMPEPRTLAPNRRLSSGGGCGGGANLCARTVWVCARSRGQGQFACAVTAAGWYAEALFIIAANETVHC